jgi:hypothetical protein
MSKFSLADLKPTSAKMELIHPVEGATGVFVELTGQDSMSFRTISKKLMKQRLAQGSDAKIDVDKLEKDNAELAASCIVGWDEEVFGEFSPEKAKEFMMDPELSWMREEIEAFVKTRTNFFRRDNQTVS